MAKNPVSRKPIKDHKGVTFPSIVALCKHYKIPYERTRQRMLKYPGMSMKEVIYNPNRRGNPFRAIYDGIEFESCRELSDYLGMTRSTVQQRITRNGGKVTQGMFDRPPEPPKEIKPTRLLKDRVACIAYITSWR